LVQELNSGLHACWKGSLPLEPCHQPDVQLFNLPKVEAQMSWCDLHLPPPPRVRCG
jgi:hypothetical protein